MLPDVPILLVVAIFVVLTVGLLIVLSFALLLFRPWMKAFMHGTPVSLLDIVAMRMRGNPAMLLIDAYITARHNGQKVKIADVERTYIASKSRILTSDDLVSILREK